MKLCMKKKDCFFRVKQIKNNQINSKLKNRNFIKDRVNHIFIHIYYIMACKLHYVAV